MKKLLLATSAIVALVAAVPAGAADMRVKAPAVRPVAPLCAQFGGFYIGAQAGGAHYDYVWNDLDSWAGFVDDEFSRDYKLSESGFAGGVTGGFNWQSGCTVFGIEADWSWASISAHKHITDGLVPSDSDAEFLDINSQLRGFGTLRARSGIVVDNLLVYVTGGLAFANFKRNWTLHCADEGDCGTFTGEDTTEHFHHSRTRWGWTVGAGTEWAFMPGWSFKSEFLYMRFEKDEGTFHTVFGQDFSDENLNKRFDSQDSVWVSRVGINYRFGGGFGKGPVGKGPVVARY